MAITPGTIFNWLAQYWYITLPVITLLVGSAIYFVLHKRAKSKTQQKENLVQAIIFDGNIRSPVVTVAGSEIKDFKSLRPKKIKGKQVYLIQPISQLVIAQKQSGNGEHEEKEEHAKEETAGKRKVRA